MQFEQNPGYATLSVDRPSVVYSDSPADYVAVSWISNLTDCGLNSHPNLGNEATTPQIQVGSPLPQETESIAPVGPGTYTLTVTCSPFYARTQRNIQRGHGDGVAAPAPTATISITPKTVTVGQQFTVALSSTNASDCSGTGNGESSGALWPVGESYSLGAAAGLHQYPNESGTYTFGIQLPQLLPSEGSANTQTTVTILSASSSGEGGTSGSGTSGNGSGTSGGKSGGGGLGGAELLYLTVLLALRRRR